MNINLKNAKELQTIKGWGTSACWWSQACPQNETAEEIANLLYTQEGLNLNIYRYNVGGGTDEENYRVKNPWRRTENPLIYDKENESYSWDFSKDANAVSFMKRCLDKGNIDTLIFFANSPHYSLCSTGQASGSLLYHTCNLPKMNYRKFATTFLDITQHFLDEGYPVKYVSPINEPQWKWGGGFVWQEGCHYECEEVVEVLHIFAEEIIKRNMPVKLYAPESGAMLENTPEYLEAILADETIMKVLDVFAFHSYHSDNDVELRYEFKEKLVDKHPEIRFDMSEWCELPNKSHTKNFKGALITARIIGQDMAYTGSITWTSWVAVNQFSIKEDGFDYSDATITANDDFSSWYVAKRYYGFAHFSKYIPVGSTVLDFGFRPMNDDNDFNAFAYKTPNGETVVVVVNEGDDNEVVIDGDFSSMKIVKSVQDDELKEIFDGTFDKNIKSSSNSIMTIILK